MGHIGESRHNQGAALLSLASTSHSTGQGRRNVSWDRRRCGSRYLCGCWEDGWSWNLCGGRDGLLHTGCRLNCGAGTGAGTVRGTSQDHNRQSRNNQSSGFACGFHPVSPVHPQTMPGVDAGTRFLSTNYRHIGASRPRVPKPNNGKKAGGRPEEFWALPREIIRGDPRGRTDDDLDLRLQALYQVEVPGSGTGGQGQLGKDPDPGRSVAERVFCARTSSARPSRWPNSATPRREPVPGWCWTGYPALVYFRSGYDY